MVGELLLEAYPLTWPERQPRTPAHTRHHAAFKFELGRARDELLHELKLLRAKDIVISSNVPTRRDGLPYADAREPADPGVAVYFERKKTPFVLACDTYNRVKYNLRAVGVTIAALRSIERHGSTSMLEQAFTGFAALPPAGRVEPWWEVLGVTADANEVTVRDAFRELARVHHPDVGGDSARMARITEAFATAQKAHA
jgi:hypothetical protein